MLGSIDVVVRLSAVRKRFISVKNSLQKEKFYFPLNTIALNKTGNTNLFQVVFE